MCVIKLIEKSECISIYKTSFGYVEHQLAIGKISRLSLHKLKILSWGKHLEIGLPSRDWAAQT